MNKYPFLTFVFFLLGIFSISFVYAKDLPLIGKVIYLDPGHGGIG